MKKITLILITISFIKCSTTKLTKNAPFVITKATYTNWLKNTRVIFNYAQKNEVAFDSVYFRGKQAKAIIENTNNGKIIIGNFKADSKTYLNLHENPEEEYGNTPPKKLEKNPFNLKTNEAIISFRENNKVKYFKIKEVKNKKQD